MRKTETKILSRLYTPRSQIMGCPLIIYPTHVLSPPLKTVLRFLGLASSQLQQTETVFYCFSVLTHMLYHTLSGFAQKVQGLTMNLPKPMLHLHLLHPEQAALI